MCYQEFIQNILNTRGRFNCGDEYHERHHIIPKCLGGGNEEENLIDLFAKEHFIAHKLLAQENPDNNSLVFAWTCMAFPNNKVQERYEATPEEYEEAKKAISKAMSGRTVSDETKKKQSNIAKERFSVPENNPFYGKHHTEETRNIIGQKNKGKSSPNKGKHLSEETKQKISKVKKGRPLSDAEKEARILVGNKLKGRKLTEEQKVKISVSNKGKIISEESKKKMSDAKKGKRPEWLCIKVAQYDAKTGYLIKIWDCIMDASRATDIDNSRIAKCAGEKYGCKTAGGFIWKFVED